MKFSPNTALSIFATLACTVTARPSKGFTPNTGLHRLASRQVVDANICENIPLQVPLNVAVCQDGDGTNVPIVPGLDLTGLVCSLTGAQINVDVSTGICLCLAAGVITPDSLAQIQGLVDIGGTNIDLLLDTVGGITGYTVDSLVNALVGDATGLLTVSTTECQYPAGSTPNSCDACTFDCPEGQQVCGNQCIAADDTCASGIPGRKRSTNLNSNFLCPNGQTACALPTSRFFSNTDGFECVDIENDVESCGGCTFASLSENQQQGQDCTALSNVIDVTCNIGKCFIQQCSEGYEPNSSNSECIPINLDLDINDKRSVDLEVSPLTDLIKNLTGIDVDVKKIDLDLLKQDLLNVEKRSSEDNEPILNDNLEPITSLLGVDLNDIDIELLKEKLATIQKRSENQPIVTLDLESITKLLGVDLNDIDIDLLKAKLAKIQ
ncbi:uncharacterized protein L201_002889 [Kwoniella dendrophila CBS 6074]|uniref:Protein CPL1-like domain-containing protein n=1 Tax=Kwoniella dendrophila CBS 6074 TaxID=1295534 RepID=A0AAX4JTX6_9TREE